MMRILGIDLSGPRNFADACLVSFEERGGKNNERKTGDRLGRPFDLLLSAAVRVRTPVRQVDINRGLTAFHHERLHRKI
jgi:hypothetical protein